MGALEAAIFLLAASAGLSAIVLAVCWLIFAHLVPGLPERIADKAAWFGRGTSLASRVARGAAFVAGASLLFAAFVTVLYGIMRIWPGTDAFAAIDGVIFAAADDAGTEGVVSFFLIITRAADVLTVCLLSAAVAAVLLWRRHIWTTVALAINTIGGIGITWYLKILTARERPEDGLIETAGESFPSGHSSLSVLMYGFLIYLAWRFIQNKWLRLSLIVVLLAVIASIGLSRIFLSVHWATDVVGGYVLALSWLIYSLAVAKLLQQATQKARHYTETM